MTSFEDSLNRRNFLRESAAGIALAGFTIVPQHVLDGPDSAAPSETVLLGNVAYRVGQKLQWDRENLKATNCPPSAPVHPP